MFCTHCGASLSETASFCTHCGNAKSGPANAVQASQASEIPSRKQCPSCGQLQTPGKPFCEHCGQRIDPPTPVVKIQPEGRTARPNPNPAKPELSANIPDFFWVAWKFSIIFLTTYFSFAGFGSWKVSYLAPNAFQNIAHKGIVLLSFFISALLGLLLRRMERPKLFSYLGSGFLLASLLVFLVNFGPDIVTNRPGGFTNGNLVLMYISEGLASLSMAFMVASFCLPLVPTFFTSMAGTAMYFLISYGVSTLTRIFTDRFGLWHSGYFSIGRCVIGFVLIILMLTKDRSNPIRDTESSRFSFKEASLLAVMFYGVFLLANEFNL